MGARLNLRVDPDEYEAWQRAARASGVGLSEWARRTLSDRVAGRDAGTISRRMANDVALILLPEIERIIQANGRAEPLQGQAPVTPYVPSTATAFVPVGPKPWDPSCIDADLHQKGTVCAGCGGSTQHVVR